MALVAVEVVVDFGIAQRAEPAVVLVVVVVAEAAAGKILARELAVVAVVVDEAAEVVKEHEALMLCKFRRVDLEAADVALVGARDTLLEAADARHAACTELFRRHDIVLRVLAVHAQAEDPVGRHAVLVVEAGLDQVELLVAAIAVFVELILVAVDVARVAEALGEEVAVAAQDVDIRCRCRRDLEVHTVMQEVLARIAVVLGIVVVLVVEADIHEVLARLRVLEVVLIMRADRMAAARRADAEAAEVRDLAEVDIRVAVGEVRTVAVLRQQGAVEDGCLLDILPMTRRSDIGDAECIGSSRQVRIRVRRAHAPIARVVITRVIDIDRYVLSLLLLDRKTQMVRAICLALEVCVKLCRIRVIDELQFFG